MQDFYQALTPKLRQYRRSFHKCPELGFLEYHTTYKIAEEMKALGFTVYLGKEVMESDARLGLPSSKEIEMHEKKAKQWGVPDEYIQAMKGGHTGLVAVWDTEKEGAHLGFRFDIDALPITEHGHPDHLPTKEEFRSNEEGVMHACGHDGHITIGLGLAHFISHHHEQVKGKFTLLFQPAEEGGRGAKAMTEKGWLRDIDEWYAGHLGIQPLPVGTVAGATRGFLASAKLNATFKGVSAHSGMEPEKGKNALLAAATATTQLYTIPRHSNGASRINVGKLTAGNGRNIIGDKGYLELEIRGETEEVNDFMKQEANRILQSVANMYDVSVDIEFVGETESVVCNEDLIRPISSPHIRKWEPFIQVSGSEDASFMMNEVQKYGGKATYMLFGTPLPFGHHHPQFDFDEGALLVAVDTLIQIVKRRTEDE
ncbi:amidohydrolase [Halobacillus litoralis]|uniref:amidohydrolase n=1 Tax=Halobacillus litoralis TaxID=45668 RepID=UPI001CD3EDAC|nr:amidohydrolase [Halobacillus litoralis]MCA0971440.1 amidohydrolase [Halobacillus litoralis]